MCGVDQHTMNVCYLYTFLIHFSRWSEIEFIDIRFSGGNLLKLGNIFGKKYSAFFSAFKKTMYLLQREIHPFQQAMHLISETTYIA